MHHWSFYFLAKLGLFYSGRMNFHWIENLLLAMFLLWPLPVGRWRTARAWLAWPLAVCLLYYDSYLPAIGRVLSQISTLAQFRLDYLGELLGRVVDVRTLMGAVGVVVLYLCLSRRIRFSTLALLGILSVPSTHYLAAQTVTGAVATTSVPQGQGTDAAAQGPDAQLQAFYASQAQRKLPTSLGGVTPPFDLVVLQVCSLSWDDLEFVGLRDHPLFQRFNVLFTQFNSAASYSGPAALRLTRGACGQSSHQDLYEGTDAGCYLFPTLEQLGFRTQGLLNHDGEFDAFANLLETRGGLAGRLEIPAQAPISMRNFDGSPIYSDVALLRRWWQQRQQQSAQPVALYYNTVSLHDGNHVEGMESRSSLDTYKPRLTRLLAEFEQFIIELESAGRPVVVLLMPEHGAALRGDRFQISGMREIPNPRITLVPVGMKLIGMPGADAPTIVVDTPVSYFDVNSLVLDLLKDSPLAPGAVPLGQRVQQLSSTPLVAENGDVVMMRDAQGRFVMRSGQRSPWVTYTP